MASGISDNWLQNKELSKNTGKGSDTQIKSDPKLRSAKRQPNVKGLASGTMTNAIK